MTIWFTSDPHFGHANIIDYCNRPFSDIDDMNEGLIRNWNELVQPSDTIYVLGDFSLGFRHVEAFAPRLNGSKVLIAGNHDACWAKTRLKSIERYLKYFDKVCLSEFLELGKVSCQLNHLPYASEEVDTRYHSVHPIPRQWCKDEVLLHGHIHERWKSRRAKNSHLMINVGVDVWGMKPVSEHQILEIIDGKVEV